MALSFMGKITEVISQAISPIFNLPPIVTILIFSVGVTLIITLINRFAVNRKLMKEVKTRMTEIRESLSKSQKEGKTEEVNKLMSEYMKINTQFMKQSVKSLLISLVVIMLFLPILNLKYGANQAEGKERVVVAQLPFSLPIIGNQMGWLLWYFLISLASSFTFKKIVGE
jgi:uncharacterized membrane protein (DUF106 family)